jgi:hypothetical protein
MQFQQQPTYRPIYYVGEMMFPNIRPKVAS